MFPSLSSNNAPSGGDNTTSEKSGPLAALLGPGRTYFLFAIVTAVIAMAAALALLSQVSDRTEYYVLKQDVAARTPVTPAMLEPRTTLTGTQPDNALTPGELYDDNGESLVAQVALREGDPVTASVLGSTSRIGAGFPDDYVVASFQVPAENAVAGKVRTGDFIDVIAVAEQKAKVVLHNVPVVDVTVEPSTIADSANDDQVALSPEDGRLRAGIPQVYTVAVPPRDAARLALVRDASLLVTLVSDNPPDRVDVSVSETEVYGNAPVDSSAPQGSTADEAALPPAPTTPTTPDPAIPTPAAS